MRIETTPWSRAALERSDWDLMTAEAMLTKPPITYIRIGGDSPKGPWRARVSGGYRGVSRWSPLDAFRRAVDEHERVERAKVRAMP